MGHAVRGKRCSNCENGECQIKQKAKHIAAELKGHAPFTIFGALTGIAFMLIFRNLDKHSAGVLFSVFHPGHVFLSAMVTAAMFKIHMAKRHVLLIVVIGYFGSVGIATLSDIIIPHIGSDLLGLDIPTHGHRHHNNYEEHTGDEHVMGVEDLEADGGEHQEHKLHLGFIEEWYIVNPAAFLGIALAMILPRTKYPHAGHVLISTWASMSYLLKDMQADMTILAGFGIIAILFLATWLPCWISDIVFPLLFAKSDLVLTEVCACKNHSYHSHPHEHTHSDKCSGGKN